MTNHHGQPFDYVPFAEKTQLSHAAIMASAGSGKTYQLIHRYLQLLFAGATPSSILATTFTRAAAGEIRDRIMSRLAAAAIDDISRQELALQLFADHDSISKDAVLQLLAQLARDLHTLQIRTLDSFFAGIVRCFSLELGLPSDAAIVDEHDAMMLRREAIRLMLDERDAQPLVDVLRSLIDGRSDRGVMQMIERDVAAMHALYREAPKSAWEAIDRRSTLDENARRVAIDAIAAAAERVDLPSSHAKRIPKDLQAAAEATLDLAIDWVPFLSVGLAPYILKEKDYYKKPIDPKIAAAYQPLIDHGIATCRNYLASRTKATFQLLEKYDAAYMQVQSLRGMITFSDLVQSVANQTDALLLNDMYYRLDSHIQHLLLDEMQDTSIQQWQGIEPIISELLAIRAEPGPEGRSFYCVGDVKQAIYDWRGACPELLESLPAMYESQGNSAINVQTLSKSFRSSPVIIDVVNRVFSIVSKNPALETREVPAEAFQTSFIKHATAKTDLIGHAELRTCAEPAANASTRTRTRMQQAADLVKELHDRNPDKTIGVLTRRNSAVNRLLFELGPSKRKVPATGRGGGPLTDTPPVNVMLDLLRLADHPDDSISAFNVRHSPLGRHVGLATDPDHPQREQNKVARQVRRAIQTQGIARTLDTWANHIAADCDVRQLQRVYELIRLAISVDEHRSLRADDFVRMIEATRVPNSSQSKVEVITIHQSKGLEFDIVILPELEYGFSATADLLVERESIAGPISTIVRGASSKIAPFFADTKRMREDDLVRQVREDLCLVYVAMTRARQGLYMLIDAHYKGRSYKTPAGLLWNALADTEEKPQPDTVVFSTGNEDWIESERLQEDGQADDDTSSTSVASSSHTKQSVAFKASNHRPLIVAPSPSAIVSENTEHARMEHTLADHLRLAPVEAFDRGNCWHAMFEAIEWIDDIDMSNQDFRNRCQHAARAAAGRRDAKWIDKQVEAFVDTLQHTTVRDALAKPSANAIVRHELPFLRKTDRGLQTGAIDRLVIEFANGRDTNATSATIIDFKTDPIASDACEEKANHYAAQMMNYREAAADIWNLSIEQVEAKLLFVEPGILMTA